MIHPVIETATLERVVEIAGAVGRDHDDRRGRGGDGAEFGDGHTRVGEELEQERLELVVGAIELVDQQHRRDDVSVGQCVEERTPDQEALAVELVLDALDSTGEGTRCLCGAEVQELARVVPLVERLGDVETLEALQTQELRSAPARQGLGHLGLAHAGLAFQEQRTAHGE